MMQHGNFFATSAIWTDFIRRIARRGSKKKKSDYFNQFQGSSVMLHGGAVGTETEEVLLQWAADLICTFQVWQWKVDKRIKASQWLIYRKNNISVACLSRFSFPVSSRFHALLCNLNLATIEKNKKNNTNFALNCWILLRSFFFTPTYRYHMWLSSCSATSTHPP